MGTSGCPATSGYVRVGIHSRSSYQFERKTPGLSCGESSLHYNGQVHTGMDGAVELERSGRGEGTKGLRTVAVDLHVLDLRCARLPGRMRRAALPGSISDSVRRQCIANQLETLPPS